MSRWVMVDDTDPGIEYTGDWFADIGTLDSLGNQGPPYLSTLHGTKTQASFSYAFSGPSFTLTGTVQAQRNGSATNTTWDCIIDGTISAHNADPAGYIDNRVEFCDMSSLADGPHTLSVHANGSNSQTFWFDHLQYQPSASVSLANAAIFVDTTDPMWGFSPGWTPIDTLGFVTNQTGAKVNFEFNGVSFKWYGFYNGTYPFAISTASYSVDGSTPVNFTLNGIVAQQTGIEYAQVFFTTETLSPGTHKAEIVYNGDASTTPLSVQVVVIQNGTSSSGNSSGGILTTGSLSADGTSSTSTPTSGNTTSNSPSGSSKSHTGIIAGGVAAGIVALLLLMLLFFWTYKRKKSRNHFQPRPSSSQELCGSDSSSPFAASIETVEKVRVIEDMNSDVELLDGALLR